jgi:hypothetical protein
MDTSLSKVPIFVLGTRGDLRNPRLEILGEKATYVDPIFLATTSPERWSRILREIALNGRKLTVGERGCALGHIKVREAVLNSGSNWAIVLEDDVELPEGWANSLDYELRHVGENSIPILLLNTNPLIGFSREVVELMVKPSGANAFLISRESLMKRRYKSLEPYEIADWPISFVREKFFALSGIARDSGGYSLVGKRPYSRTRFLMSTVCRLALSPLICVYLRVSFSDYLRWSVLGPIIRDIKLRYLRSLASKSGCGS